MKSTFLDSKGLMVWIGDRVRIVNKRHECHHKDSILVVKKLLMSDDGDHFLECHSVGHKQPFIAMVQSNHVKLYKEATTRPKKGHNYNIYVAGPSGRLRDMAQIICHVKRQGHIVTHDWTGSTKTLRNFSDENKIIRKDEYTGLLAKGSRNDIQGVVDADILLAVMFPDVETVGMYYEMGAAMATQTPILIVNVGYKTSKNDSFFTNHPFVIKERQTSIYKALGFLNSFNLKHFRETAANYGG